MNTVPQLERRPFKFARNVPWAVGAAVALAASSGVGMSHSQDQSRSGAEIVAVHCAQCHGAGAEGAPRIGDREAWVPRAAQGLTSLTRHALEGIRKMPPHGGNPGLSDAEIRRAITYMVNRSGGRWVEPIPAGASHPARSGAQVVSEQCAKCHAEGVGGAPRIGDRDAWLPRFKNGVDALVQSAIHGHGGMPPRGGQANLTDDELRAAVLYMFIPESRRAHMPAGEMPVRHPGYEQLVGGLRILLGYTPAQALRSFPEGSAERVMHGGVPEGAGYYHFNVTLLDRRTDAPIRDARVEARIERLGMSGETIVLRPMAVGEASYGGYAKVLRHTPYSITLSIRTAQSPAPVAAVFRHTF